MKEKNVRISSNRHRHGIELVRKLKLFSDVGCFLCNWLIGSQWDPSGAQCEDCRALAKNNAQYIGGLGFDGVCAESSSHWRILCMWLKINRRMCRCSNEVLGFLRFNLSDYWIPMSGDDSGARTRLLWSL